MKQIQSVKAPSILLFACLLALPSGCAPKVDTGGYVRDAEFKEQLIEGTTTKDEVLAKYGSPSSQSSFGAETWYYITDRKEAYGFLKPEVVQQDVVRIEFDTAGVVSKIQTFNKDDGKDIRLAKRTTPTEGHTLGFVEQILGNIGRFNRPSDNGPAGKMGGI